MFKRTVAVVVALAAIIFMTVDVEAAKPSQSPDVGIEALTNNSAFGTSKLEYMSRDVGRVGKVGGDENRTEIEIRRSRIVENNPVDKPSKTYVKGDNWLIYWYICGSDIESGRIAWDRATSDFENGKIVVKDAYAPGDITRCIREVERANISSGNVEILMQAGGTYLWGHKKFQTLNAGVKLDNDGKIAQVLYNGKIGRYLYDNKNKNWKPHDTFSITANPNSENDRTDMGSKEGLIDFLRHGKEMEKTLYPDGKVKRIFIFVDHGGGSLLGVGGDEYTGGLYGRKISIKDIHDAFDEVWKISETNPPFELVAFDACLMSTYETAVALKGVARYMVASEEAITGKVMFEYKDFLSQLSAKPTMNGEELGRVICDTYYQDCLNVAEEERKRKGQVLATNPALLATMSVVDLSKMPVLESAYENFSKAVLNVEKENPRGFFTAITGRAKNAEHYVCAAMRTNEKGEVKGHPTMLDLKDFAVHISQRFKSVNLKSACDELIQAIDGENYDGVVVYNQVRGRNLSRGGGLSTYYPFAPDKKDIDKYEQLAADKFAPKSQSKLYLRILDQVSATPENVAPSKLPSATNASNGTNNSSDTNAVNPSPPKGSKFDLSDLKDLKVNVDHGTNTASVKLTQDQMERVASVRCILVPFFREPDKFTWLALGNDTAVKADWDTGEFTSTFSGKWIRIEGHHVFVNIVSESSVDENGNKNGSELYSIPIKLNDRMCTLLISGKYPEAEFTLIGARPDTNSNVPTGELYGIKRGDIVTPILSGASMSLEKMYDLINQSETLNNWLQKLLQQYPEFERICDSDMSNEEKDEAAKKWMETLPEDEKKELERVGKVEK